MSAVAGFYGPALWQKIEEQRADAAADATISLGRRLLRRLLGRAESRAAIQTAVNDLAKHPNAGDFTAALRLQILKALEADPDLADDVSGMVRQAGVTVVASGPRAVAAHTISGNVTTGDHSAIHDARHP